MCSKVSEENYSSLAPMGPYSTDSLPTNNTRALLSANLQNVFQNESEIKKYFETKTNCSSIEEMLLDSTNIVSEERLVSILNEIAKTEKGCDILKALKSAIDNNPNEKVAFVENDEYSKFIYEEMLLQILSQEESIKKESINAESKNEKINKLKSVKEVKKLYAKVKQCKEEEEKIEENRYAFDSAKAIEYKDKKMPLIININKNLISDERYIFDKNKITTHKFPANEKSEAYSIAHELTHVVSFLNFFAKNPGGDWYKRKNADTGWVDFFNETEQMKEVYHGLLLDGFTPKQIIDAFRTFFLNTEEARNVLGLVKGTVDGRETLIGEFHLFTKREVCSIVLYPNTELDQKIRDQLSPQQTTATLQNLELGPIHRAILNRVTNKLNDMYLPKIKQDSIDAEDVLGSQFEGFNLVNVPRENSAIEAIKKVIPNSGNRNFFNIQNSIEEVTDNYVLQQLMFSTSSLPRDMIKQQVEIDHLQDMASLADRDIVLIRSDDKNPQNYTFKKFDTNGQETTPKSFEEIKEKNPNAVFIYYNGVNHFQALVPQQPAQ